MGIKDIATVIGVAIVGGVMIYIVSVFAKKETVGGRIYGTVIDSDTGSPIEGASVLYGLKAATTSAAGEYEILNTELLSGTIMASKTGYESESKAITSPVEGEELEVNFALTPSVEPTIAGHIGILLYWYEGMPDWEQFSSGQTISVPQDTGIYFAIGWINDSNVNITGHIQLLVVDPDDITTSPSAYEGQDIEAIPGEGHAVAFGPISLNKAGTWTFNPILTAPSHPGSGILDSLLYYAGVAVPSIQAEVTSMTLF